MKRTLISDLVENEETKISGFATKIRDTKYMIFVVLRDRTGSIQVSIDKANNEEICTQLTGIIAGSVLEFEGKMVLSEYVKQGGKEFLPIKFNCLSSADASPLEEMIKIN